MRHFSEKAYRSLKCVCSVAYDLAGGNTLFQHSTRVVVSQLSKYASLNQDDEKSYMPIDVAVDLDRAAGSPVITGTMAQLLGFRLEPLSAAVAESDKLSERDAHKLLAEAMDVSQALLAAFADGRIDALERKRLRVELREVIRAAETILAKLDEEVA
ncbi:phage regulatory CII family protein [Rhizobium ruizarguesonis]